MSRMIRPIVPVPVEFHRRSPSRRNRISLVSDQRLVGDFPDLVQIETMPLNTFL